MFWRNLALLLGVLVVCFLSGCASPKTTAMILSTAGTFGPKLTKPLPQDQHILVLSVLRDVRIDIIGENIFIYNELGTMSLPASAINTLLSKTMATTLKDNGYMYLDSMVINNSNVLNTTDIQWMHGQPESALSPEAQRFLSQVINHRTGVPAEGNSPYAMGDRKGENRDSSPSFRAIGSADAQDINRKPWTLYSAGMADHRNVDTIILLTQSGNQPLAFDVKCELSKQDFYQHASIEPHLYLYKIYVIDAHTLKILTWITGSANGHLQDTRLCKPTSQYRTQDFNELRSILMRKLESSVAKDLNRTLGT